MRPSRSLESDNNAVVHPEVLEAIRRETTGMRWGMGMIRTRNRRWGNSGSISDPM